MNEAVKEMEDEVDRMEEDDRRGEKDSLIRVTDGIQGVRTSVSVTHMPITSISASNGATIIVGEIGSFSTYKHHLNMQQKISSLRDRYSDLYACHGIYCVEDQTIIPKTFYINDFAVNLRMVYYNRPGYTSFHTESNRYLQELNEATSYDVDIENLIDRDTRVTFLSGIAGIGKSVLSKKIVYGWANGTIFKNFHICLYFECREMNEYLRHYSKGANSKETLNRFIAEKLYGVIVEDGDGILIVIDGVDELLDITEKNSLIFQFLDKRNSYRKSKIIMTGRPHIKDVLHAPHIDIGKYKVFEIIGLADKDIEEYVTKFILCIGERQSDEYKASIDNTIKRSKNIRSLLCVPQFLNTICCVSILNGAKDIFNEAELYSWVLYLLLKQHVLEREETAYDSFIPNIFTRYSRSILLLSNISFQLYSDNRLIFAADEFKSLFNQIYTESSNGEKSFIDGLFIDVSNNFGRKLQFKHLSLMEYFSAIHICTLKNPVAIVEKMLNNNFAHTIRLACGIFGSIFQGGITAELYKCVLENDHYKCNYDKEECAMTFLSMVLELYRRIIRHRSDPLCCKDIFSNSLSFISHFLCDEFKRKEFVEVILCDLATFGSICLFPNELERKNLVRFFSLLRAIGLNDSSIKFGFQNLSICLYGNCFLGNECDIEIFTILQYLTHSPSVSVSGVTFNEHGMKCIADNFMYCTSILFESCEFTDHFIKVQYSLHRSNLENLTFNYCTVAPMAFRMISKWTVKFEKVMFLHTKGIGARFWVILSRELVTKFRNCKQVSLKCFVIEGAKFDEYSLEAALNVFVNLKCVRILRCDICSNFYEKMASVIMNRKIGGTLKLRNLHIEGCSNNRDTRRSIQQIQQCGVQLTGLKLLYQMDDCESWAWFRRK